MLGFRYAKASPTTYLIQYRNGQPVREGAGFAFFYFAPTICCATRRASWAPCATACARRTAFPRWAWNS